MRDSICFQNWGVARLHFIVPTAHSWEQCWITKWHESVFHLMARLHSRPCRHRYFSTGDVFCGELLGIQQKRISEQFFSEQNFKQAFQAGSQARVRKLLIIYKCLDTANSSNLGLKIVPHCVSAFWTAEKQMFLLTIQGSSRTSMTLWVTKQRDTEWYLARTKHRWLNSGKSGKSCHPRWQKIIPKSVSGRKYWRIS